MPRTLVRPGDVVQSLLSEGERTVSELHRGYRAAVREATVVKSGRRRAMTYHSFATWFSKAQALGLVVRTREEPMDRPGLFSVRVEDGVAIAVESRRVRYTLSAEGAGSDLWANISSAYPSLLLARGGKAALQPAGRRRRRKPKLQGADRPERPPALSGALPDPRRLPEQVSSSVVKRMLQMLRALEAANHRQRGWSAAVDAAANKLGDWAVVSEIALEGARRGSRKAQAAELATTIDTLNTAADALLDTDLKRAIEALERAQ